MEEIPEIFRSNIRPDGGISYINLLGRSFLPVEEEWIRKVLLEEKKVSFPTPQSHGLFCAHCFSDFNKKCDHCVDWNKERYHLDCYRQIEVAPVYPIN